MAATDDRVVSMHFDNAEFQKNVGATLGSLDALKKSLNFDGANQAFANVEAASGRVTLGHMGDSIEGVSAKFLALTTVAVTALANITTKALDAGLNFAKSFTVSPIMAGFSEMETKIGSIQTILANTARFNTGLPEVTGALDELNHYADKTIYDFGQMTHNIGLFTNAGINVKDATSDIKGFSNAAAASGTTAEGAAGAAYQLSQAMSAGTIRLMDWKSLTNVGMGNKNMQEGLIQIAQAMGRFNETGDDAKEVQKNFNASLESGWLDADTMSKYLKIMSGDMSAADMKSMHLSDTQIKGFQAQAATAFDAATKVRTFTQLVGTIKESIGSGWTDTFETVLGDFNQATDLFTGINNAVGGFVGKMSDARNKLLGDWAKLGGRTILINGLKQAMQDIGAVIKPIHDAFREIFPPETAANLVQMTRKFAELMQHLKLGPEAADKLKRTFAGVFALFDIIKTVLGDVIHLILHLVSAVLPSTGEGLLGITANAGDFLVALDNMLVKGGKLGDFFDMLNRGLDAIHNAVNKAVDAVGNFFSALGKTDQFKSVGKFFTEIAEDIEHFFSTVSRVNLLDHLKDLLDEITGAFGGLFNVLGKSGGAASDGLGATESGLGRVGDRAKTLADEGGKILDFFERLEIGAANVVKKVAPVLGNFFSNLGQTIAAGFQSGSFDQVFDVLNVGLLGGIILMLRKFFKQGLKLDIGGGLFGQIKQTLGEVTSTLKTMQAQIKAKALMEIAIAMGVLTVSIIALSLVDSENLAKSLAAMAIGFGELVGVMKLLDQIAGSGTKGSAKLTLLVGALMALAGAALILTGAIALIGSLSWDEIGKGLVGITGALVVLVGALKLMDNQSKFTAGGSLAIIGMAKALNLLATATASFGQLSMAELGKGLAAVGIALGMIVLAMNALPGGALAGVGLAAAGVGMLLIATSLGILAGVVKLFAMMSVEDLAKGLIAMGIALGAIGLAMQLFPPWLPLIAVGMMLLAPALAELVAVVAILGHMNLRTLIVGITSLALILGVLAAAMILMEDALPGALAAIVVAGALILIAKVVETLGSMPLGELAKGIGAIAAVLLVFGLAALLMEPILPALFLLGVSLTLIGVAFALFGVGALAAAKAFELFSRAGSAGVKAIIEAISEFLKAIPMLVGELIAAMFSSATELMKFSGVIIGIISKVLGDLLDLIIQNVPKIAQALLKIITAGLDLIRGIVGDIVDVGFIVLEAFLKGLRDHIDHVTQLAVDIIVNLAETLRGNMKKLVDAAIDLLLGFLGALANRANDVSAAGLNLLLALIAGMINNLYRLVDFAVTAAITFAQTIGSEAKRIIDAGVNLLLSFLSGMVNNLYRIIDFVVTVLVTFAETMVNEQGRIIDAGVKMLGKFLEGLAKNIGDVTKKGVDIAITLLDGMASNAVNFVNKAATVLILFLNGMATAVKTNSPAIDKAADNLVGAIMIAVINSIKDKANHLPGPIKDVMMGMINAAEEALGIKSPSRVFYRIGTDTIDGIIRAFDEDDRAADSVVTHAERIVAAFQDTLNNSPDLAGLNASPVITPVLDLTQVRAAAQGLDQLMAVSTIAPTVSLDQARLISTTTELADRGAQEQPPVQTELTFVQNNYSPDALSTNDIYRNTKSQIALAKEELDIS